MVLNIPTPIRFISALSDSHARLGAHREHQLTRKTDQHRSEDAATRNMVDDLNSYLLSLVRRLQRP
jgi:hypothetical protein